MSILGTITSLLPKADVIEDIGSEMTVSLSATVDNAHSLQKCLHQLVFICFPIENFTCNFHLSGDGKKKRKKNH
jgi:hypothetical protein